MRSPSFSGCSGRRPGFRRSSPRVRRVRSLQTSPRSRSRSVVYPGVAARQYEAMIEYEGYPELERNEEGLNEKIYAGAKRVVEILLDAEAAKADGVLGRDGDDYVANDRTGEAFRHQPSP